MMMAPVLSPEVVGVKLAVMVQDWPGARVDPQVVLYLKSPKMEKLRVDAAVSWLLVRVTVCVADVDPTPVVGKTRSEGVQVRTWSDLPRQDCMPA